MNPLVTSQNKAQCKRVCTVWSVQQKKCLYPQTAFLSGNDGRYCFRTAEELNETYVRMIREDEEWKKMRLEKKAQD